MYVSMCVYVCVTLLQSHLTFCNSMDCSPPVSSVHRISRQENWSGLPCPPPRNFPNPGFEPEFLMSPALAGGFFITSATREAYIYTSIYTQTYIHTYGKCIYIFISKTVQQRDGNTRPPYLPPAKPICRSRSNN